MDWFNFTGTEKKWQHYLKCVYLIPLCWVAWIIYLAILIFAVVPVVLVVDTIRNGIQLTVIDLGELATTTFVDTKELWDRTIDGFIWKGPNAP